ncbi:hypothetical protein F0562_013183 [Nyssa sinensis]|uniref:Uncharacterized protein n=1 Tax=Nyssa sinensis TaxID=561372 RepID=A0A5J4ZXC6_9ASTE|nr:hypothetical protein F0562_013183 [Nyssa sinensis]
MKCRSVACIWSGSPPVHRVTATAVLNQPPTLYTGGSDGSIIWWNLSTTNSNQEIKPIAMLCGHAAPIVDLGICFPIAVTGDGNIDNSKAVDIADAEGKCHLGWGVHPCLGVVQTVFHGTLSIGPLKFIAVVLPVEDMETQSVLMADSFGKLQCVPILKESNTKGENGTGLQKNSSHLEMTDLEDGSSERGQVVTFAICNHILALVYRTYCIFRLVSSGTTIGEIYFVDQHLGLEGCSTQSHVIGAMFLESDNVRKKLNTWESENIFAENFAVWNNRGSAIVYRISYSDNVFEFEPVSMIPAAAHPLDVRLSICFSQVKSFLLRIESVCFHVEEPLLWKPHVTIWLLPHHHDNKTKLHQECKMLGEGGFFVDWSAIAHRTKGPGHNFYIESTVRGAELTSPAKLCSMSRSG